MRGEAKPSPECPGQSKTRRVPELLRRWTLSSVYVMAGQGSPGRCHACGERVLADAAFVDIGPTDIYDRNKPRAKRFVPAGTDIHGWTPFELAHPECFKANEGAETLRALIDASRR